jgi:hypothetical protein
MIMHNETNSILKNGDPKALGSPRKIALSRLS